MIYDITQELFSCHVFPGDPAPVCRVLADMAQRTPVGRNGTPADVAQAMVYLAQADFVTGQVLPVNGGYVI